MLWLHKTKSSHLLAISSEIFMSDLKANVLFGICFKIALELVGGGGMDK